MKKIEFLEEVKINGISFDEGDRKSFSDEEAAQYISLGWAKDVETGETGERVAGVSKLSPVGVKTVIS